MFWLLLLLLYSSVRRVKTNYQRLTEYSRLYISNTFLSILAVPYKAVFCITPTFHVIPSFPIHLSNSTETLPRAPITKGTISTFLNFRNLLISLFNSWYFSTFSFSFSSTLTSAGTAISIIIPFCSFLSITIRSGRLASVRLSHWIFMSHSNLISSFLLLLPEHAHTTFHCVLTRSFYKYLDELSLQHCLVIFCIISELIFHICLLCVAHFHLFSRTIYTGGCHSSYQCGNLYSLS